MDKKINNILTAVAGMLFAKLGSDVFINPYIVRKFSGYVIDLTGYNKPLGVVIFIVGILLAWSGIKGMKADKKEP